MDTTVNSQVVTREEFKAMTTSIRRRLNDFADEQKQHKVGRARAAMMVNRYRITATLDYWLAWRGREYRHASRPEYRQCWAFKATMDELVKEFGMPNPTPQK